ncbi:MAG: ABC transporter permease [Candidatus Limnocylindrales bacterium]
MIITTRFFPTRPLGSSRAHKVLERDVLVYRRNWTIIVTGFFEPIFYLLGIGFGLGTIVGDVGDIPYAAFVAPGLMATAAMNGALFEATFNLFFKLKYAKTFDAILATPLGPSDIAIGEVSWALTRGLLYAIAFLLVMLVLGLVLSPLGILMIPGALLIGLAAASVGMAATTYMRKWQDFDVVTVVTMPMFLFSGTFFPISVYPDWLETMVELTPLYRGVHMLRSFSTGEVGPMVLLDIVYLAVMGLIGVAITARRLRGLLLK